ncbi:MAG: hypothetical protein RBS57_00620 [Desulforhabdus sp.]|nr:hypothetical protein [Desulforhabdus sp.]
MKTLWRGIVCLILAIALNYTLVFNVSAHDDKEKKEEKSEPAKIDRREKSSETYHEIAVEGKMLNYKALAGEIFIQMEKEDAMGKIFYTAYTLSNSDFKNRPVTFLFNGGPGSAALWLHMGGLGPKRIEFTDDGRTLPPPVRMTSNTYTWLAFTDLVFVDPIGTGYSRGAPNEKKTNRKFYGYEQDIVSVAEFIRLYITRNDRWLSPKFLLGESYGTTRVSGLTWRLHQRFGIDLNGVLLISPVLDFSTILFHPSNDLPYILFLPTYAATAWYHAVLPGGDRIPLADLLAEVEHFCLDRYVCALAMGSRMDEAARNALAKRLRAYTGLQENFIREHRFRIDWMGFTRNLLPEENKIVGRMDSTKTGIEPDPTSPLPLYDPSLDPLFGPFSSAVNAYIREELRYKEDLAYEFFNSDVTRQWDWSTGLREDQGFLMVSHTLRDALAINRNLKVFIASGLYDLATPYFAVEHTVNHMWLKERREDVIIETYPAGHMMYTHREALEKLFQDARSFYALATGN